MTELLPWIIVAAVIAAAIGFALGRRNGPFDEFAPRAVNPAAPPAPWPTQPVITASTGPAAGPSVRPTLTPAQPPAGALTLATARSWGYQLQNLDLKRAAASPFDLLVIDHAKDGSHATALTAAEVERLKSKPDGSRRLVVAYCSIGEAESYRAYWQKSWAKQPPAWLLGENPEWEENYAVCFWDPAWQRLFCGSQGALIDQLVAQGFDGIYLDKCDVTEDLREHFKAAARSRPDLDGDMVAFVERIAATARAKRPGFLVIMQNAEPLLERPELRRVIDAVAKEELLYGLDRPEKANTHEEIEESRRLLDLMRADGKPVFVVEYLGNEGKIRDAATAVRKLGYTLYVAPKDRELNRLGPAIAT